MHLTRTAIKPRIPVPRKGTKYIARAASYSTNGIPVVVAIRDMLKLAQTSKEVKHLVHEKLIEINGKTVKDIKESIRLFNTFKADKTYRLTLLTTGRFTFEETKQKTRFCKIINKTLLPGKKTQLNLHDGTNIVTTEKTTIGDTVELDEKNKIKKVLSLAKGKNVFIISGKSIGQTGTVKKIDGKKATIHFDTANKEVELDTSHIFAQ